MRPDEKCLAHAVIIATARLNHDPNYTPYRKGNKIRRMARQLLDTSGIDLKNGAGIPELTRFEEHFHDYKIVVY